MKYNYFYVCLKIGPMINILKGPFYKYRNAFESLQILSNMNKYKSYDLVIFQLKGGVLHES